MAWNLIFFASFIIAMILPNLSDTLTPPRGLKAFVRGTSAQVSWIVDEDWSVISHFQLTYQIVNAFGSFLGITQNIDGISRAWTLRGLLPLKTYKLFMVTVGGDGYFSNASEVVTFTTSLPEATEKFSILRHGLYPEEVVFILIVVVVWVFAMVLFYKQWDSIRILQPMEPRYKHSPKNLETIRIVKRAQDSVIYKNYSRKLSITMLEREKRRLQRMHTAPALPTLPQINALPTIQMEDVTTEM